MNGIIRVVFFSPTGTTRTITSAVASVLAQALAKGTTEMDATLPARRGNGCDFHAGDVLVLGFPVYGGRIPEVLKSTLEGLRGQGTPAVLLAVYGNRDYDDALLEAHDLLGRNGFVVVAAAAFVAEHSLTAKVGTGRPDANDLEKATVFARQAAARVNGKPLRSINVKGQRPYKARKAAPPVTPKTTENCTECLICARHCPLGVISIEDPRVVREGCIRCCACVKSCPAQAKYFDDPGIAQVVAMLESKCLNRREPELFL